MARQIGYFLFFIGIIASFIAAISFQVKTPSAPACLIGILMVGFGLFLMWRNRTEAPTSERFKTLKKLKEKKK